MTRSDISDNTLLLVRLADKLALMRDGNPRASRGPVGTKLPIPRPSVPWTRAPVVPVLRDGQQGQQKLTAPPPRAGEGGRRTCFGSFGWSFPPPPPAATTRRKGHLVTPSGKIVTDLWVELYSVCFVNTPQALAPFKHLFKDGFHKSNSPEATAVPTQPP